MKLITFRHNNTQRLGALLGDDRVVDLHAADPSLPDNMMTFLNEGDWAMERARNVLANAPAEAVLPRDSVTLAAPVPKPGKIICIGLNYRDHAAESNQPVPDFPTVFAKYSSCVIAPGEPIMIPRVTEQVDYEAELGFVIGKCARHVSEADALDYVAGYVPFHDVSARDYQMRTSQWTLGKTFDTFGPMGPALVTKDEIPDPQALDIELSVNGEVLQKSNTRELVFTVQKLVALLSEVLTLEPGDLISTGTPSGVGAARNPKRWLRPGETVSITIAGLGTLTNPVIAEQ
jgi:acylpyruvate hydrolase